MKEINTRKLYFSFLIWQFSVFDKWRQKCLTQGRYTKVCFSQVDHCKYVFFEAYWALWDLLFIGPNTIGGQTSSLTHYSLQYLFICFSRSKKKGFTNGAGRDMNLSRPGFMAFSRKDLNRDEPFWFFRCCVMQTSYIEI